MSNFLFDTNVFIQAKNLHYQFSFCKGFWDWVSEGHAYGLFYSSRKVYAELMDGHADDEARAWAKAIPSSFFLEDSKIEAVMEKYTQVIRWAYQSPQYTDAAKAEFAQEKIADAFLIALAKHGGYTIVTQEKSSPDAKKKIFLPDAAKANGVKTVLVFDLLNSRATSTFQLAVV